MLSIILVVFLFITNRKFMDFVIFKDFIARPSCIGL